MHLNLDELFPAGIASVFSTRYRERGALYPAEAEAARLFSPVRVEEFRHGRSCARLALGRLGASSSCEIPVGPDREPLWPDGIVGSISHAGRAAAAAVAWRQDIAAVGIDLEPLQPLEPALITRICRPEECRAILDACDNPGETARQIFSMKEAAYKALWPTLRCFLDFHDLEIHLPAGYGFFSVASRSRLCPPSLAASLTGRCAHRDGIFASAAVAVTFNRD